MPNVTRRSLMAGGVSTMACFPSLVHAASPVAKPAQGMRYVWATGSGTLPGESNRVALNAKGEWVNAQTGRSMSESAMTKSGGPAGLGYTVMDVTHALSGGYVTQLTSYLSSNGYGGPSKLNESRGIVGSASQISDFWIAPQQLSSMADGQLGAVGAERINFTLGTLSFNAIRIQTQVQGGWVQKVYDLDSGILLSFGSTTETSGGGVNTNTSFSRLQNARALTLPGFGDAFPQNMRGLRTIQYQGQTQTVMDGLNPYTEPLQITYSILRNQDAYLESQVISNGTASPDTRVSVAGVIGSLWMNPQTLQKFSQRAVLDTDPQTGVTVSATGRWNGMTMFSAETQLFRSTSGYDDNSGILMQSELVRLNEGQRYTVSLNFAGAQ